MLTRDGIETILRDRGYHPAASGTWWISRPAGLIHVYTNGLSVIIEVAAGPVEWSASMDHAPGLLVVFVLDKAEEETADPDAQPTGQIPAAAPARPARPWHWRWWMQ